MLYAPHFLTGALVMKYSGSPVLGLPLALLSHIILDMMPHNDFEIKPGITLKEFIGMEKRRRNRIIAALVSDYFLTAIAFFWVFFNFKNIFLILGGLMGILPDFVEQFLMLFGVALPGWQEKLQWRVPAKYGFIYYPVVSFLATYFLLK